MPRHDDDRWDDDDHDDRDRQTRVQRRHDSYDDEDDVDDRVQRHDDFDEDGRPLAQPKPDECNMAMLCHLGGIMGFIIPLVIWLVQKDKSKFVDRHGKEVVNFQLTILIVNLCNVLLALCLVGFVTLIATMIFSLVLHIQGSMAASRGEDYRYPLCIRFIK
jgi:uncharacterized Tic20 family protein